MQPKENVIHNETIALTVPFHDTDAMGVVWHGNYFRYFEIAREALLRKVNYSYEQMKMSGYAWPVVDARAKYIAPVIVEQRINITATITEYENRLRIDYKIVDSLTNKKLTTGYTIQVAVNMHKQEMCFVCPSILWKKLGVIS
ncbi:acyl-CoA thioesterase [Entomomonas moraniae]|uniref:Acyl-CoA thioesterase n=1 Tax=Entomomonas moraniae TaxID=2213226 RepID=A0A3Q9JI54_9GAMM|nr:thioesterase family protein [Entomomonas moraniae]AZS50181.1 acyl-CoA thioesterase [Entomomonas moraniae]